MAANDKIRTPDYNDIQSSLATIMGSGSGTSGWGQSMKSSQVSVGNKVTINEWANLRYDIINAYTHVFGSAPTTAQAKEGFKIRYSNTFVPDTGPTIAHQPPVQVGDAVQTNTDQPVTQYATHVSNIVANKFTVGAGQYLTSTQPSSSTYWPGPKITGTYGPYWTSKISCTVTVDFGSAANARYFFNSGGQIYIASSASISVATQQNTSWASILSAAGTVAFGGNNPGTGTAPSDGTNWYRLDASYQQYYRNTGSSPYGSNYYKLSARCLDVTSNTTGTASRMQILVELIDGYTDPGIAPMPSGNPNTATPADFPPDDAVYGTFTVSPSYRKATGVLVPTGFGNFTIADPLVTISALAP